MRAVNQIKGHSIVPMRRARNEAALTDLPKVATPRPILPLSLPGTLLVLVVLDESIPASRE